jgi:hypothetical protein
VVPGVLYPDNETCPILECDVSSVPTEIDLEEIQTYAPSPITHNDYIPATVVAPHVGDAPSIENTNIVRVLYLGYLVRSIRMSDSARSNEWSH